MKIGDDANKITTIQEMLPGYRPPTKNDEAYITDKFCPSIIDNAIEHIKYEYSSNYQDVIACAVRFGLRRLYEYDSTRKIIKKCRDIITGNTHKQSEKFKELLDKNYLDFGKYSTSRLSAYIWKEDARVCGSLAKDIGLPNYMIYRIVLCAGMIDEPVVRVFEQDYFFEITKMFGEWITENTSFAIDIIKKYELNTTFKPRIVVEAKDIFKKTINNDGIKGVMDSAEDL